MAMQSPISNEFSNKNINNPTNRGEVNGRGPIRNIVTKERQTVGVVTRKPSQNFAANDPRHRTTDETFRENSKNRVDRSTRNIQTQQKNNQQQLQQDELELERIYRRQLAQQSKQQKFRVEQESTTKKALELRARVKATRLNMVIGSVGWSLWLMFQLPIALMSLVAFGVASTLSQIVSFLNKTEDDGLVAKSVKTVLGYVVEGGSIILDATNKVFDTILGFDLKTLAPDNLFMVTYLVIIAFALMQFFIIYIIYKTALINPLGGKKSELKMGTFMLAMAGYSIPLLNIFPWFLVWITAVWLNPK